MIHALRAIVETVQVLFRPHAAEISWEQLPCRGYNAQSHSSPPLTLTVFPPPLPQCSNTPAMQAYFTQYHLGSGISWPVVLCI